MQMNAEDADICMWILVGKKDVFICKMNIVVIKSVLPLICSKLEKQDSISAITPIILDIFNIVLDFRLQRN